MGCNIQYTGNLFTDKVIMATIVPFTRPKCFKPSENITHYHMYVWNELNERIHLGAANTEDEARDHMLAAVRKNNEGLNVVLVDVSPDVKIGVKYRRRYEYGTWRILKGG